MKYKFQIIEVINLIAFFVLGSLGVYVAINRNVDDYKHPENTKIVKDYNWFYQQYSLIKIAKDNFNLTNDKDDKEMLNNLIKEYNRQVVKQSTRGNWQPFDLPYQIKLEK